jgi:putative aldouronate transport system substrate-binding protein
MKKRIVSIFVLALVSLALYGGGRRDAGSDTAAPVAPAGRIDPLGKYDPPISITTVRTLNSTIRFDQNDPDARSLEQNRWTRVYREDMGINLGYTWIAPDAESTTTKWNASIAAYDVPDFASVGDAIYKQLYDADLIEDMGSIFPAYATAELKSTLTQTDYQMMTMDGKLLGFPAGSKALHGTTVLFIRKDWLDKLGLKEPTSIAEVVAIGKAFKEANLGGPDTLALMFSNDVSGGWSMNFGDGKWDGFMNGYGAYFNYWLKKNGRLEYSDIQPEMRTALLALQDLNNQGLINKDIAVTTPIVAQEYVASERVGIFYATAWQPTQGMQSVVAKNPSARYINVFPPSNVPGQVRPMQTNSPRAMRTYVKRGLRNPEAPVKMANLAYAYKFKDWKYYMTAGGDIVYFKYLPWGDCFAPAEDDLKKAVAIREAELTGRTTPLDDASYQGQYDSYLLAKEGKSAWQHLALWGPGGSFSTLYDQFLKGNLLINGYYGLPTETQSLKEQVIRAALTTAMFDVVMGADISVWDRAVARWKADGGDQITKEVNDWYQSVGGN